MSTMFMVIGEGPNGLEIPLVPFGTACEAEEFIKQFPGTQREGRVDLDDDYWEKGHGNS